jgi:uncharacterized metal-binding protein
MSLIVSTPKKKEKQSPYKHAWVRDDNGLYGLIIGEDVFFIWEARGGVWNKILWKMSASIGGKKYRGERPTLEEAAKASDRLLYKNLPHVWTVTDARAIIDPWRGDLNFEET